MNIFIAIFIILTISFSSCKDKKQDLPENIKTKIIEIDPQTASIVKTSSIFDSLLYIPLKGSKQNALLGEIDKIETTEHHFYVLDKKLKKLYQYSINGEYIRYIGRLGQRPGEYVSISDFTIDKDEVLILDRPGRKILTYTIDGEFKNSKKINMMAQQIAATNDRYFLYTNGSDYFTKQKNALGYNLFITDKECNILKKLFKYNPSCENIQSDKAFDLYSDDNLIFNYALYDTIYQIKEDHITEKYVINFKGSKIPISKVNNENFNFYLNKSGYARLFRAYHTKDYLIINYIYNNRVYLAIHKKNTLNIAFLENDIDKTSFALPMPMKVTGKKAIFIKYANDLINEHKAEPILLGGEKITSENNPVLVIGYLK